VNGARGSSLVEVLVALLLLGLALGGIVPGFLNFTDANTRNERRTGAVQAARVTLEADRAIDPATMPDSGSSSPDTVIVGGRRYEVTTTYCPVAALCDVNSRHLLVEVTEDGETLFSAETVFTKLR